MNTIQAFVLGFATAFILATFLWMYVYRIKRFGIVQDFLRFVMVLVLIVAIGYFVYPTPYHYSMYMGQYPVKINWIMGKTEVFGTKGWVEVKRASEQTGP